MLRFTASFSHRVLPFVGCVALAASTPAWAVPASEATSVATRKVYDTSTLKGVFKGQSKVVIAGYQIAFVTRNKATAHAGNYLGGGSGAKASLETFVGNVDLALMQAIANEAYVTFAKKMQDSGLEVVPLETLKASAAFKRLETTASSPTQAYKVEFQGAHYILVAGGGLPLWFNKFDGLAGGKGSSKNIAVMAELAKELNAAVIQPSIAVDFAYLETSGGKLARRAGVEAKNGMMVVPAASVFWGSVSGGLAYTKFIDGFWVEGETGKWVNAEEASNRGIVKGLSGLGIDIGPVTKKKALVLEANPALFKEKTLFLLEGTAEVYQRGIQEVRR